MPVNQPQTIQVVFAILTLFAATASGQQWGGDLPVYQPKEEIFGSDKVSEDVSEFFKSGIEDELIQPPTDSDKPIARTARASLKPPQSAQAASQAASSLVDKNGYLRNVAGGGIWADVLKPASHQTIAPAIPATPQLNATAGAGAASTETQSVVTQGLGEFSQSALAESPSSFGGQPAASQQAVSQAPILGANNAPFPGVYANGPSKLRLRVGFDILAWERGRPDDDVFSTTTEGQQTSFGDFDLTDSTPRIFIQFMGDDLTGFEFTFFDFNTFGSTIEAESATNVETTFFNSFPSSAQRQREFNYNSRLKNIELNSWFRENQIQRSGWGIRYINLDENFDVIRSTGNIGLFSRVDNNIWGVNRMWERRRPLLNRLEFTGGLDLGLYLNNAQIDVDTLNIDDSSEATNVAGSLGFNFGLEYLAADHVTLRFGYEGLGLFGVALASTQSLEQEVVNGLEDPDLGSLFFGGFHFGAIASF